MNLSIFGAQPLQPLADEFADAAEQAAALSVTLGTTAGSVSDVQADAAAIGVELEGLAAQLEALRDTVPAEPDPDPRDGRAAAGVPHAARCRGAGGGLADAARPAGGGGRAAGLIGQSADRMIRRRRRSEPK